MKFINYLMELLKQLLLLGFQILVLLKLDLVLPLKCLILFRSFCNLLLAFDKVFFDLIVSNLLLEQSIDFFTDLLERSNDKFTVVLFNKSLLVC